MVGVKGIDADDLKRAKDHPPLRIGGNASCRTCKHGGDYCTLNANLADQYPDYDAQLYLRNLEAPLDSVVCDAWESYDGRCGECGR